MAVTLYELVSSRRLQAGRNGAGFTARFLAVGSTSEAEVYQAAVLDTTVSYFNSLHRSDIRVTEKEGGPYWEVEIDYSPIPLREAIQSPGLTPGSGSDSPPPQQAPDPSEPIGPGYSFSTGGGTTRIYQSLETRATVQSLAAIAANRILRTFDGAINVTDDNGAEGVDIVSRQGEFSVTARRPIVTLNYIQTVMQLTGTVNAQPFYGWFEGEVLYLGAEGQYAAPWWTVTHKFSVSKNETSKVIARDPDGVPTITLPLKRGWDYVWTRMYKENVAGSQIMRPEAAYVEKVYESENFALLEIG